MTIDNKSRIRQNKTAGTINAKLYEFQHLKYDTVGHKCSPNFRYLVNYSTYES